MSGNVADTAHNIGPVPGRTTIDDVARAAGVSRQTVSNVVRERGRLSEATRERVLLAIHDLQYEPHPGASSLRSRRTRQLAHLLPAREMDPANVIALEFVRGLVAAAARHGYFVMLGADGGIESLESLMRSGRVDGFVFSAVGRDDPRIRRVAESGFPFTSFGRAAPDMPQAWVDVDNRGGVAAAVRHLVERGHRRIGYLTAGGDDYWEVDRISGFRQALAAPGLAGTVVEIPLSAADLDHRLDAVLTGSDRPTGLVVESDALAAAVYRRAARCGRRIGSDVAMVGLEGGVVGRSLTPSLTTVAIPVTEIAELVVDRVLREIDRSTGRGNTEPGQLVPLVVEPGESS